MIHVKKKIDIFFDFAVKTQRINAIPYRQFKYLQKLSGTMCKPWQLKP